MAGLNNVMRYKLSKFLYFYYLSLKMIFLAISNRFN